jgi:hypothetical protein
MFHQDYNPNAGLLGHAALRLADGIIQVLYVSPLSTALFDSGPLLSRRHNYTLQLEIPRRFKITDAIRLVQVFLQTAYPGLLDDTLVVLPINNSASTQSSIPKIT